MQLHRFSATNSYTKLVLLRSGADVKCVRKSERNAQQQVNDAPTCTFLLAMCPRSN